jgi:hypothetical protein
MTFSLIKLILTSRTCSILFLKDLPTLILFSSLLDIAILHGKNKKMQMQGFVHLLISFSPWVQT